MHVLIQRIGQHRQQIVRGLLRHFRGYEFLNLLRDAIGLRVLVHHCSSRHLYAQVVGLQPVDSHAGSTEHAAGQSTAEEADTNLLCLIRKGQRESLVIIVAKLFVGVDRLLPFALIAGDRDVCEQIEELRAYFLAALGQGVLADLYKGAFAARGDSVQELVNADLLGDYLCRTSAQAERQCLLIAQSTLLRRRDGRGGCATAHQHKAGHLSRLCGRCTCTCRCTHGSGSQHRHRTVRHTHAGLI